MSPGGKAPRARGDSFERLTRRALEQAGWLVVRSGGSLGCADLVALRSDHQPWMVSCKATTSPYLVPMERAHLYHTAVGVNAVPVLAFKPERGISGVTFMAVMHGERLKPNGRSPFARVDHH